MNLKKISINKNLIPLKLALFFWFGGASIIYIFIFLYLRKNGLSLTEIAILNIINPIFQTIGPTICGIIADKTGKSKPVVFVNYFLNIIFVNSILFIPFPKATSININCDVNTTSENSTEVFGSFENCSLQCGTHETSINMSTLCNFCEFNSSDIHTLCEDDPIVNFDNFNISDPSRTCNLSCIQALMDFETPDEVHGGGIFVLTMVLVICFNVTLVNIYGFTDVTTMTMAQRYGSTYGRERFWAIAGLLVLTPIAGYIIQEASTDGSGNYVLSFYIFDVLAILSMLTFWKLDIEINPPAKDMLKNTFLLLKNTDVFVFIVIVLIMGTSFGFKNNYQYLYLEELGAPSLLISLVPTVVGVVGLPFLFTSGWWIRKVGSANLLVLSLVSYTVGFTFYSYLKNPWLSLICETMTIFNYHLMWIAVMHHSHEVSPKSLTATVITTAGSLHYAFASTIGSLTGGLIFTRYGARIAFRTMAVIDAVVAILYAIFIILRRKRMNSKKQQDTEMK